MNLNHSEYTIAEIVSRLESKEVKINRDYQRGGGIWPKSAKSYFIDTVLEQYPFPKLYFYQVFDRARRRPAMEVVDGQQRLLTIREFMRDEFSLSKASRNYSGKTYSQLDEDTQEKFQMTRVQVDVVLAAERTELLEMFRRMNAYTAPLNAAEKRHAQYQGRFKWFAVELADRISPTLEAFGILTPKQMIRMGDAELISELVVVLERGIVSRSERNISNLYKKYDKDFPFEEEYTDLISGFFTFFRDELTPIKDTLLARTYAVHSLFCVYAHHKRGIPNGQQALGFPQSPDA